jgi:ubiquinone/menaquinone biosynthesis C-methylase UbiE
MAEQQIRFQDGAAYERTMGVWSRLVGEVFLDWLAPRDGLRWIDIGCGNSAFTELLVERCAPAEVQGIDPSEGQLAFARTRPAARLAQFQQGNAMALPFLADRFDAAVMALVVVFVPDPAKGVAEMARVVRPGGTLATYVWDMLGSGPHAGAAAAARGVTHGRAARDVDGCRARGRGDARDHRATHLRGFRGVLDHQPGGLDHRPCSRRHGSQGRGAAQGPNARPAGS